MAKPAHRPYSAYSRDAVKLLGQLIRQGRIDKKLTAEDVAYTFKRLKDPATRGPYAWRAGDIKEVYSEAKSSGFETKIMRQIVRLRKMEPQERSEQEQLLDVYKQAIGMI